MARRQKVQKTFNLAEEIKNDREVNGETQELFWGRFGVTQSAGSRYESGRSIPNSTAILLYSYLNGLLSEHDLHEAKEELCIK